MSGSFDSEIAHRVVRARGSASRTGLRAVPLLIAALLSCSDVTVTAVDVAVVQIEPVSLSLVVGDTARFAATIMDADGNALSGRHVTWSSSRPETATVSSDGRLIALESGEVTITASSGGVDGSASVVIDLAAVIDVQPDSVAFDALIGSANSPAPIELDVQNEGDGLLVGLTAAVSYDSQQPAGWLTASLADASAPTTLTLTPDAGTLAIGTYRATVTLTSESARPSSYVVPVTLTVRDPPPSIGLDRNSITFTGVAGGSDPPAETVTVTNGGNGELSSLNTSITYMSGPSGWLTADLSSSTAPSTLTLIATPGTLGAGRHTATVQIVSGVAANSPQSISVTFDVQPSPARIEVSPSVLGFSAAAGGFNPGIRTVDVTNAGTGTLDDLSLTIDYAANQPTDWLTATLSETTAPATVTLQPSTGTLAVGTYTATVSVFGRASNSPQTITVSFVVTPTVSSPAIALSSTSAAFQATAGGTDPASQSIAITNSGGGGLNGLAVSITYASNQPNGWLTANLAGTVAPTSLSLQAATGTLAAGTYNATVDVSSPVASNSPRTITVTFTVTPPPTPPPVIALNPTSLTFYAVAGGNDPGIQDVAITNSGGGTLDNLTISGSYGPYQPGNWLKGGLSGTVAPATLSLQPTTGNLGAGTYTATASVASPVATNSPQSVAITFYVVTSPFAPQPPTRLRATVQGTDVRLDWNDNSSSELVFRVERATQWNGGWSPIGIVAQNTTTFTDTTTTSGTTYYYRVVAIGLLGSSVSNIVAATP